MGEAGRQGLNAIGARPRRLPTVTVFFALAAILIQSFLVQTHIHFGADLNAATSLAGGPSAAGVVDLSALTSRSDIDRCLICHEQMSGGRVLAVDAVHLLPPNAAIFLSLYAEALCATYGIISHSWQGRGPPRI